MKWNVVVLAFGAMLCATAHARIVVRHASDLENNEKIGKIARQYRALSAANVIFDKCATDYPTIAQDKAFLAQHWEAMSQAYADAYHDAYVERVGYPPDAVILNEYVARIRAVQQNAVNKAAMTIQSSGCRDFAISPTVDYIHQLHEAATKQVQGGTP